MSIVQADTSLITVDIPVGTTGLNFSGKPVQVVASGTVSDLPVGSFVHSLQLIPDVTVSHIYDAERFQQLVLANTGAIQQRLCVSKSGPPTLQPVAVNGFYFSIALPTPASCEALGLELQGFPPRVLNVAPTSPLANKVHARQVVHSVAIPGQPEINATTPGFTAHRVQEDLRNHASVPGIVLVVKEELIPQQNEKGTSVGCVPEDCVLL